MATSRALVLCLFALAASPTSYLYPPPSQVITNLWRDEPCALRAWVRAEDLHQGSISHGELRVQLIQPCAPGDVHIASVGLRLQLDEYVETTQMVSPELALAVPSWQWHKTQQDDWVTRRRNQTTFASESIISSAVPDAAQLVSPAGVVLPFSVASPDVPYPAGIFPLSFHANGEGSTTMEFGRAYRYVAFVLHANGTREDIAAGYTSFVPAAPPVMDDAPEDVALVAALVEREADDDCDPPSPAPPRTLALRARFPRGRTVVPGTTHDVLVELSVPGDADAHTTVEASLVTELELRDGSRVDAHFSELRTSATQERYSRDDARAALHSLRSVPVPANWPSRGADGAHFAVGASLRVTVQRLPHASTFAPEFGTAGDLLPHGYVEDEWASGPCAHSWRHRQRFIARVPLALAPPLPGHGGRGTDAPSIFAGHVELRDFAYARAAPTDGEDETAGMRALEGFPWPVHDMDGFVGQYVGSLWERRRLRMRAQQAGSQIVL